MRSMLEAHVASLQRRSARGSAVLACAAAALLIGSYGCSAGGAAPSVNPSPATIQFENRTDDVVRVYLRQGSLEWRLGRVEPGRRAALPVPSGVASADDMYTIAILPVGAPNPGVVPSSLAVEPLTMRPATLRTLVELGWTLQGRTLTAHNRGMN